MFKLPTLAYVENLRPAVDDSDCQATKCGSGAMLSPIARPGRTELWPFPGARGVCVQIRSVTALHKQLCSSCRGVMASAAVQRSPVRFKCDDLSDMDAGVTFRPLGEARAGDKSPVPSQARPEHT